MSDDGGDRTGPLAELVAMARLRRPDDPLAVEFLPAYYRDLPEVDVDGRPIDEVYAVAMAHLALGRHRDPGTTQVKVVSPELDIDGWQSARSVVLVVTDDAPFLVDSIRMVLDRRGIETHLLVHPMLSITRASGGELLSVLTDTDCSDGSMVEAWTQIEIDRCGRGLAEELASEIAAVVGQVHQTVADFDAMRELMASVADEDPLLEWLADGNFVFVGAALYDRTSDGGLVVRPGTELGELRGPHELDPPAVALEISDITPMVISRSDAVSTIHRATRRTCVSVRAGNGSRYRFIGLHAASAYRQSVLSIPGIADRAISILGLTEGGLGSHTGRSMRSVLETLPRDLVFELDTDTLARLVIDIVGLQERQIVRLFDVPEPVGQWSTVLVYLPRTRFDAAVPDRVASAVAHAYGSPFRDLESAVGTSTLARITLTVRRSVDGPPPDLEQLAVEIDTLTTSWRDRVYEIATREIGAEGARSLLGSFDGHIPAGFQASVTPERAVGDLVRIGALVAGEGTLATAMSREIDATADEWRFRVYRRGTPVTLSELLPLFDHLGLDALDERPYTFTLGDDRVYLYDIGVRVPAGIELDVDRHAELLSTFEALVDRRIEPDGLNRLVLVAGLRSRDVAVLRTYVRYLRQVGFSFSQSYIEDVLARMPKVAAGLVELFHARFDPRHGDLTAREPLIATVRERLDRVLDTIQLLDDDRICRGLASLVEATTRTNVHRGSITTAMKFDPSKVPDLPAPRPRFEIFVCSPRVEGVHLRGGRIARGGLRWSDRREDFRTEVLGLVKAQMVKNAVIVPVGAKGGFVLKQPPEAPEALRAEVTECYRQFVGALLELTDDIVDGQVVHPSDTVVHDDADPYLVVAADKGTATFSDLANSIALDRGFWLGDAFASGGSAGYDHKVMGITARGAWESVRRHARSLGLDADRDPITVVGIGDMSGDVFGNGMLRSPHLHLVAAFDHRHVFIDPDPDPEVSFAERSRLFDIPRSSWGDYDTTMLSPGGGVYARSAKSITLSAQARRALGITVERMSPIELVRAILTAPVDLLWNGGIGTYVKASTESHGAVGDRANDAVRVDATALRCRMVGEGGNLGVTQLGRIEYALAGGLINTDAIDNAAGVDCSDHEVNIKILLGDVVVAGEMTGKQRNELLASMTDEVAELVLDNNRAQTLALTIARRQAHPMVNVHARYLDQLEYEGWIDRELEFMPIDKQLAERQATGHGLTVPEFAVMIAYTKNANVTEVLGTDLPDDPVLVADLERYFPVPLRERFADRIRQHRLRREIVSTQVVNQMVNLSGISYDHRMTEETGASVADVTRAWVAAREILGFASAWEAIDALDTRIDLDSQLELFLDCRRMAERCSLWLLRNRRPPLDIAATVEVYSAPLHGLGDGLASVVRGRMAELVSSVAAERVAAGVPEALARRSSIWRLMHTGFDLVEIARRNGADTMAAASMYWHVFDRLDLMWLWSGIGALPRSDRWQTQARSAMRDDLLAALSGLTGAVMAEGFDDADEWAAANERTVARTMAMFTEIRRSESFDVTILSVALRQLRNLAVTVVGQRQTR